MREHRRTRLPRRPSLVLRTRRRLARADRRLLAAAAARRSPGADRLLIGLSHAADDGLLWLGIAALLSASGRRRPRTAAVSGLVGLGLASASVNGPMKLLWRRDRPPTDVLGAAGTLLPLPRTFSFPSGHSASALAFATGVGVTLPAAAPAVLPLAAAVAYSRVHTGVHFPSDVLVGAGLGAAAGAAGARIVREVNAAAAHHADSPALDVPIPRHAVLLASPRSGSAAGLGAALAAFADIGVVVERRLDVAHAAEVGALVRAALADGREPPLVVAAGGDGTVGAAADAVAGTGAVLAIVPLGTSNDVARSLGVPTDPARAAALAVHGAVRAIDAGRLQHADGRTQHFVNAASAGLNVAFAELATTGRMRRRFGGPLGFRVPGANMTDGLLNVVAVERLSLPRLSLAVGKSFLGRHTPVHRVHAMRVPTLRVSATSPQQIAADGEVVGNMPVDLSIRPAALRVVTPVRVDG